MRSTIQTALAGALFTFTVGLAACGPGGRDGTGDDDGSGTPDAGGGFQDCDPSKGSTTCQGQNVVVCNADGTYGEVVTSCGIDGCSNGSCGGDQCSEEAKLIYVVDKTYNLLSFDPKLLPGSPFKLIGQLNCPAGNSLPDFDPAAGPATPFSMSVDRSGRAWVLYSSGQIFHVSTMDASCQATGWVVGTQGFELFGMGFVSDSAGSDSEKLYIAGGDAANIQGGNLGTIDPSTMQVTKLGTLPVAEYSPELTGTGNAELWGYYPGTSSTFVAHMDRSTAQSLQTFPLPALQGQVSAWAFAHHGGRYYIFVTTSDILIGNEMPVVLRLDPATGQVETVVPNSPYVVVGAGVSTCAPVVIDG
jgi:hypothetical protein